MNRLRVILLFLFLACFLLASCLTTQKRYHPGGPYYYKTTNLYLIPEIPSDEITKEEALDLASKGYAYRIVYFNEEGLITKSEKRYQGKTTFQRNYIYQNSKLQKWIDIEYDGQKSAYMLDSEGNTIKLKDNSE